MSLNLLLLWALVGWVGLVWPPQLPPPPPPPDPRWFTDRLINMVGSLIGGLLWNWAWPVAEQASPGLGAGMSCIGAVIGAALLADVVWLIRMRTKKA